MRVAAPVVAVAVVMVKLAVLPTKRTKVHLRCCDGNTRELLFVGLYLCCITICQDSFCLHKYAARTSFCRSLLECGFLFVINARTIKT